MKLIVFGLFFIVVYLFAEELSIDTQIAMLKDASAQQRVEMMNQIKQKLAQMNEAQRREHIVKLQQQINPRTVSSIPQEHTQQMQLSTNQQLKKCEDVQQQNALQQYQETVSHAGGGGGGLGMGDGTTPSTHQPIDTPQDKPTHPPSTKPIDHTPQPQDIYKIR